MNKLNDMLSPKVGETWFLKIGDSTSVSTREVTDITAFTVELRGYGELSKERRYELKDVTFIEKKD